MRREKKFPHKRFAHIYCFQSSLIIMFSTPLLIATLLGTLSSALGYAVTSDDSGKYLSAVGSPANDVLVSKDYGKTWTVSASSVPWSCATSDSTGQRLNVASSKSGLFPNFSWDGGATWNSTALGPQGIAYYNIDSDATGWLIYAAGSMGIHMSSTGGDTWYSDEGDGYYGMAVAVSGDASSVYIGFDNFISYKSGSGDSSKWVATNSEEANWNSISTDFTGKIIAGSFYTMPGYLNDGVYLSEDRGATYLELRFTTTSNTFNAVKVSSDGSMLYYVGSTGVHAYKISTKVTVQGVLDKPITTGNWLGYVDCSKNGKYVVIGSYDHVWVSSDYGATFKQTK